MKNDKTSKPAISVIMPVYNAGAFLAEAIESILTQTYRDFEFLIVDDGSTDGSGTIISSYAAKDKRIRCRFGKHRGTISAMAEGVRISRGAWIARMDHDDVSLRDRLAAQLEWAMQKGLDLCGAQVETFGTEEQKLWFPETHEDIGRELLFRCPILYPTTIIRASLLRTDFCAVDINCVFDDYELATRLAPFHRLGNMPSVLLRHRMHEKKSSKVSQKEMRDDFQKYRFRYFYRMFPNTPLSEYIPLARVSDCLPMKTLPELERAGRWLTKLSEVTDEKVTAKMRQRWQETCGRSTALGREVDHILDYYMNRIGNNEERPIGKPNN